VLLRQDWRDVAFLHWEVDPDVAAPLLPAGTRPDLFEDRTFVGLVALRMRLTAPPWPTSFGQANVRLYSVDEQGRRGVVFRSLDADRLLPALAGRVAGLPYRWARVRVLRDGDRRMYGVDPGGAGTRTSVEVRVGPPVEPGPVEQFVTARWGLHHRAAGHTIYTALEHRPWQLHAAELARCDTDLVTAAGLPVTGRPMSVLFSPGLDGVRIGSRA
jgi:uncharacterized protein